MERHAFEALLEERAGAFEGLKAINEKAEAEGRDLTAEEAQEYDRVESEFDSLTVRIKRAEKLDGITPTLTPGRPTADAVEEGEEEHSDSSDTEKRYAEAFEAMVRNKGLEGLDAEQRAALKVGAGENGGYTVPKEFYNQLVEAQREFGVMRQLATVITTEGSGELEIPGTEARATAAWTAEAEAFTESEDTFKQVKLGSFKLGALSKVSDELLHDSAFDIMAFLAKSLGQALALKEDEAFVAGTSGSTTTPEGIVKKGTATTFAAGNKTTIKAEELITLYHALLSPYRANASWIVKDSTVAAIRKLKDTTEQFIYQPGLTAGVPDTLLGRPFYTDPNVPAVGESALSVVFGDISSYWIRDVQGVTVKVLNELYAANGQVGFRIHKRTDGDLVDTAGVVIGKNSVI